MKGKKTARQKTGAPPAYFLLSLEMGPSVLFLIEHTRAERASLAGEPTKEITKRVWHELLELAERVRYPRVSSAGEFENAAQDLAAVATAGASFLEDLARTDAKPDIILAAARKTTWPVNLRLGVKRKKGELCPTFESADKVKDYLISIRLGESPERILKHVQDPEANPFKRAAEMLVQALLDWREKGMFRAGQWDNPWARELVSLDYPMTAANVGRWWAVAKLWMDEQWESNRDLFRPLIKHLKLDNPQYTESMVKSRVIDDSLKKAFKALVAPAES